MNVNTLAVVHAIQLNPASGASHASTSNGSVADTAAISAARVTEPRCQDVYSVTSTPRKNAPSSSP